MRGPRSPWLLFALLVTLGSGCDLVFSIDGDKPDVDAAVGDGRLEIDGFVNDAHADPGDEDSDGIPNADDSCPGIVNLNIDNDGDQLDDACDPHPCDEGDSRGAFYSLDQLPRPDWIETGTFSQYDGYIVMSPSARLDGVLPDNPRHMIEVGTRMGPPPGGQPTWAVFLYPADITASYCQFVWEGGDQLNVGGITGGPWTNNMVQIAEGEIIALRAMIRPARNGLTPTLVCQVAVQTSGLRLDLEHDFTGIDTGDTPVVMADSVELRWLLDYRVPTFVPAFNCPN